MTHRFCTRLVRVSRLKCWFHILLTHLPPSHLAAVAAVAVTIHVLLPTYLAAVACVPTFPPSPPAVAAVTIHPYNPSVAIGTKFAEASRRCTMNLRGTVCAGRQRAVVPCVQGPQCHRSDDFRFQPNGRSKSPHPLATEKLLENTDGELRPPPLHQCSLGMAACYLLFMLTRALLLPSLSQR